MGRKAKKDKKRRRHTADLDALETWRFGVKLAGVVLDTHEPDQAGTELLAAIERDHDAGGRVEAERIRRAVMSFLPATAEPVVAGASPAELLALFVAVSAYYEAWNLRRLAAVSDAVAAIVGLAQAGGQSPPSYGPAAGSQHAGFGRAPGRQAVTGGLELLAGYARPMPSGAATPGPAS